MKRCLLAVIMALGLVPYAIAASGVISTNGSTCTPSTNCLVLNLPEDKGGATLTLSGTWTGTIQFEATGDGGQTWASVNVMPLAQTTPVTSTTGDGTWQVNTAGFTGLRMRSSATMTGSATGTITPSFASARNGGSGTGGTGCVTAGSSILYGNGSGGCNNATIGTGISFTGGTLSATSAGGTVTSVSSGSLSPLFTVGVATPTTTPAFTFTLSSAAQNSVLAGPASGGAGAPSYQTAPTISAANMTNFPTFNQNTTGNAATATAAQAAGTECSAGAAARGVDGSWNAIGCFTPTGSGTVNTGTAGTPAVYLTSGTAVSSGSGITFSGSGVLQNVKGVSSGTTAAFGDTGTSSNFSQNPGYMGYNTTDLAWEMMTAWQDNSSPALDLQAAYATSQDSDEQNTWNFQYWPVQIAKIEDNVANSYAVLASVGDSDTSGFGSTQLSWLYPFVTMAESSATGWGTAGVGFVTSNSVGALKNALPAGVTGSNSGTWTYCGWSSGTVTNGHSGACWGPDNTDATASANGAYQQITATGTNFFVHGACQSGGASLHIFVDGTDTANASTNCTAGQVVSVSSGNLTEGSHVIKAQQVGSGTLTFTGFFGYDTTLGHGVAILKMAAASTSAIDFATNPNLGTEFAQIQTDLVSVFGTGVTAWTEMTGANENNQGKTTAAMITAINTLVGDMHTASPLADIAVFSDPDDGNNTGLTASGWQYEKAIQGYDNANRYPFISFLRHTYPESTNSPSNRGCFAADNIHLGPNCQQVMAKVVLGKLNGTLTNPYAGSSGSGTTNYIAKWTSSSVLGNSQLDDGATNANTLTYVGVHGIAAPNGPLSGNIDLLLNEGTCPAGATGHGFICSSSSNHQLQFSNAGGTYASFVGSTAALCSTCLMTGAGSQNAQTPNSSSTLDGSGNLTIAGKYNGITLTALTGGFSAQGGTSSKTLTIDNTLELAGTDSTKMTFPSTNATITQTVASGTSAMGTSAISSGTCASAVTTSATGVATTDAIIATPNGDPTGTTGYAPSASGGLYIVSYPTSGNVNFKVCNNTASSITPGALTLNWRVVR